jgi:hypothetical protein
MFRIGKGPQDASRVCKSYGANSFTQGEVNIMATLEEGVTGEDTAAARHDAGGRRCRL